MPTPPDISIRQKDSPYDVVSSLSYFQSKIGSGALPVLQGEVSDPLLFRIYNNFALNAGIEDALNVQITVYDGAGSGSHTFLNSPASLSWLHVLENGFGESTTVVNDPLTKYTGQDTPVGGSSVYIPEKGSAGTFGTPTITGSNSKAGFVQLKTYLTPPANIVGDIYYFVITVLYEYV